MTDAVQYRLIESRLMQCSAAVSHLQQTTPCCLVSPEVPRKVWNDSPILRYTPILLEQPDWPLQTRSGAGLLQFTLVCSISRQLSSPTAN